MQDNRLALIFNNGKDLQMYLEQYHLNAVDSKHPLTGINACSPNSSKEASNA